MTRKAILTLAQEKINKATRPTSKPVPSGRDVRIFVSYSHVDAVIRDKLETHLAALTRDGVSIWYDGNLQAGDALGTDIARALRQSDLFIALLSPDYIASHYCWKLEYQRAMNRRARGTLRVIAVVARPCDWKSTTAAGFKLLPADGKPISRWRSQDQALLDVIQGIRKVVQTIRREMVVSQRPAVRRAKTTKAGPPIELQTPISRNPPRATKPGQKRRKQTQSKSKR